MPIPPHSTPISRVLDREASTSWQKGTPTAQVDELAPPIPLWQKVR